jgi:molybdopterin molybdotransferase
VGLLSTGSELLEVGEASVPGRIYNSNRYTFAAELSRMGFDVRWLGTAPDSVDEIRALLEEGLRTCDAVLSTGGVSVGDYDVTAKAMEEAGAGILFRGVSMKPGMACAYGVREGKLVCGLSGNPASSLINFHVIAAPAFRRIAGWAADRTLPSPFPVALAEGFGKPSPLPRFLRGRLDLSDGGTRMRLSPDQGNIVLSSSIGMDMIALVPAGSGRLEAGTMLEGFLI